MDKLTEITKLIIVIGCVLIGLVNLIIFPIIDLINPNAHIILNDVIPLVKQLLEFFH